MMFGKFGAMLHDMLFTPSGAYASDPEAIVLSCFFNPTKSAYRLSNFTLFYSTIKHLNHKIIECAIGDDDFQLSSEVYGDNVVRVRVKDLLFHKETLLNQLIAQTTEPYVFWIDADVIFTNKNWLVDAVRKMKDGANIIQPFKYCIHLEKDENEPSFNVEEAKAFASSSTKRNPALWRSFASNWSEYQYDRNHDQVESSNYDVHGHVGFAWGATRRTLESSGGLYDKALIGGADHIMAHAAVGQLDSVCVNRAFAGADMNEIHLWSRKFFAATAGRLAYVQGDLYHLWHGDIKNREYLKRIQDFAPVTKHTRRNPVTGFHETDDVTSTTYMQNYFQQRENTDYTTPLVTAAIIDDISSNASPNIQDDGPPPDAFFVDGGGGGMSGGAGASGSFDSPTDSGSTFS
jgi:hypothetical protein